MPEEELNLFQFATRRMTQPSTCPPEIVRCQPLNTSFAGVLADHVPDRLSVRPSPQAFPVLLTRRNSLPAVRLAAPSQSSSNALTQAGIGIVLV